MSFKIQDSLAWIAKALGIDRASSTGMDLAAPATVLDTIQAVVPAKAWGAAANIGFFDVTVAGPTQSASGPEPPPGQNWYVFGCDVRHNQATTHTIRIDVFHRPSGLSTTIRGATALGNLVFMGIERPILLRPGMLLSAESNTVIIAGSNLRLKGLFVRLEENEYMPGSPYG